MDHWGYCWRTVVDRVGLSCFKSSFYQKGSVGIFALCPSHQSSCFTWLRAKPAAKVVTYNLYWWCVSDETGRCPQYAGGKGFAQIYARLQQNGPFDLIGFQECDNVGWRELFALWRTFTCDITKCSLVWFSNLGLQILVLSGRANCRRHQPHSEF